MSKREAPFRLLSVCLCVVLMLPSLSGCRSRVGESGAADSSSEAVSETQAPRYRVVFVGNSLTFVGQIPQKFEAIAESQNRRVKATDMSDSGYTLAMHAGYVNKSNYYRTTLGSADAVVFQEYGAPEKDTVSSLKTLIGAVNPDAKLYFLLTEFDVSLNREQELKEIPGLTFIPSGYAHDELLKNGFVYEQLHQANDYHPNDLYGYAAALAVYRVVMGGSIDEVPYETTNAMVKKNLYKPGASGESKEDCFAEVKRIVSDAVTAYQERTGTGSAS